MEHLYTSKGMSRIFRGLVLALAVILVACGGESDDPEPTATIGAGQEQEALPTVPPMDSTPDTTVSEEEITVLEPDIPATSEAATPDVTEEVAEAEIVGEDPESTPASTPTDPEAEAEVDSPATVAAESTTVATDEAVDDPATAVAGASTPESDEATAASEVETTVASESTPDVAPEEEIVATADTTEVESTPEPGEETSTGNETFTNPGDGTGGSGMPGEQDSNVETEEADQADSTPVASPSASPIAQLTISGCEVPDVPGFLGESNIFLLTEDVNFRSGPGVDCEPVFDEPIGEGQIVLVLGGPVTQADDGTEWVQIEANGEPGWVTTEFLEPSE